MISTNIFTGDLIRLASVDPEEMSKSAAQWIRNTEYWRMLDTMPVRPWSETKVRDWEDKNLERRPGNDFYFAIRTLADDRLIGGIDIGPVDWPNGDGFVGIAIGAPEDWGKGYGTDAMRILLRFAFTELNLQRVSLDVFEYNPRGVRSYEKAGFVVEGRVRGRLHRDGRLWDEIYMGVLREDWERERA